MGGYDPWDDEVLGDGLYQFDTVTFENEFIPVTNLPLLTEHKSYVRAPAMVFVPSLDRIYFFGGWEVEKNLTEYPHNEIFYVDLTPLRLV